MPSLRAAALPPPAPQASLPSVPPPTLVPLVFGTSHSDGWEVLAHRGFDLRFSAHGWW